QRISPARTASPSFPPPSPGGEKETPFPKQNQSKKPSHTSNPPDNSGPLPIFMSCRNKLLNHTIILPGTLKVESMSGALEDPLRDPAPGADAPDEHVGMLALDHGVQVAGADKDVPDPLPEHL